MRPKPTKIPCFAFIFSQKMRIYAMHGFTLSKGHLFHKNARLCSKHFEDHYFQESYLMEIRMMGSSKMRNPLKPDAVPTLFARSPTKAKRPSSVQCKEKQQQLEVCIHLFHCLVIRLREGLYRQYLKLWTNLKQLLRNLNCQKNVIKKHGINVGGKTYNITFTGMLSSH